MFEDPKFPVNSNALFDERITRMLKDGANIERERKKRREELEKKWEHIKFARL